MTTKTNTFTDMDPSSKAEADRLLGIASNLLEQNDLNAAREFALLAQETDPLHYGPDQITAIADVLTAANKRINDHHDWYAILQIDTNRTHDPEFLKQQYRRLGILLYPDKNTFALAESAFRLIGEARSVLSNPSKKAAFDKEYFEFLKVDPESVKKQNEKENENENVIENEQEKTSERPNEEQASDTVWTPCPYCYHMYEYPRVYEGCCLRCVNCNRAFEVVALPSEAMPEIVPGKEAYRWPRPVFNYKSHVCAVEVEEGDIDPALLRQERYSTSGGSVRKVTTAVLPEAVEKRGPASAGGSVPRRRGRPAKNRLP